MPDQSTRPISPHEPHRFVALDALRAVAAFAVIGFHLSISGVPHGYLAVDFFFLLSGFVVTFAYQNKLDTGHVTSFARARLIRLYPLYLLGLLLGIALAFIKHLLHFPLFSLKDISVATFFGLFLLPTLHMSDGLSALFPLNTPAWSLFDEAVANVCHALFFRRRGVRTLSVVIGLSALALLYTALTRQYLADGYQQNTALSGIVRCIFTYSVGAGLCVLWRKHRPTRAMPFSLSLLLLTASFFVPHSFRGNAFYDFFMIAAVYPCLLWFSTGTVVSGVPRRILRIFAESSYAIYIIHLPLFGILALAWNRFSHHRAPPTWVNVVFAVVVIAAAIAADFYYDRPFRRVLTRKYGDSDRSPNLRKAVIARAG